MIDLTCTCGRTYTVPPTKAGRKLQCKRCGAVSRIPHPESDDVFVVPFQVTEEAAEAPLDLAVAEPTHRCPSCGTTDDVSVVICVRCGYDWRTGERITDAHDEGFDADHELVLEGAVARALQVQRWGLVCLTPLGVALGPVTLLKSLSAENELPNGSPEIAALAVARLQAAGGFVLWTAVIVLFAWWYQGRGEEVQVHIAAQCEARLEHLGARIKQELEDEPTFPARAESLRSALREIAETDPALNELHLRCPLAEGLYAYKSRDREELTQGFDAGYILIWDQESHPDKFGQAGYRALRFDGKVETFPDRESLEEGLARDPFGQLEAPDPSATPSTKSSPAGRRSPKARRPAARLRRFVALAQECDRRDPWLEKGLVVESLIFTERSGIPPQDLLPVALRSKDVAIRRYGARMLARSDLPPEKVAVFARDVARDKDLDVRFAIARALQRARRTFLIPLVPVIEESGQELREATLRLIGREAARGPAQAELVLRLMVTIRTQAQAGGDEAIFTLPKEALKNVAPYLGDPDVGIDARAVFLSAGKDAIEPLRSGFRSSDRNVRRGAFTVAQSLVEEGVLTLEGYLGFVRAELDPSVQAKGLEPFLKADLSPDKVLTAWLLSFLREAIPTGPVGVSARKLLARVGQGAMPDAEPGTVEQLVDDLTVEGNHEAVLAELASDARLKDLQVDELLEAAWNQIPDALARRRLVDLLAARPYESAQRTLLNALTDPSPEVRAYAIQALLLQRALRSDRFRRDAARLIGKRLRKETDPLVRQRLLEFAQGKHVCGRYPSDDKAAKHSCSEPIMSYLRGQAKKGDRAALRCIGTHPSQQAVSGLIEVLKAVTRDRELRSDIISELNNLTGFGRVANDVAGWEKQRSKRSAQLAKRLNAQAEREREGIRRANARAEKRAQSLIKKSGPKRRGL
ncbi:MAG: hypothetical protein JKY65_29210 [Planctomycetes bacterium]|nr:hypothetical protein [Planctomycetota bacterium]